MSKSTQRSGTRITCSEVVDLCERIYTENPDLPVVGARVLGLFLCVSGSDLPGAQPAPGAAVAYDVSQATASRIIAAYLDS